MTNERTAEVSILLRSEDLSPRKLFNMREEEMRLHFEDVSQRTGVPVAEVASYSQKLLFHWFADKSRLISKIHVDSIT